MGGMTSLLLLMWVGVTVSTVVNLQKRIIGGKECDENERLYHVKLIVNNGQHAFLCGGSLISDQWILTVAHCNKTTMTALFFLHPHQGVHHEEMIITAKPEIFKDNKGKDHDIMLLKLPKPVTQIQPVKLPECRCPLKIGTKVQVAGYAATTTGPNNKRVNDVSETLQCANIQTVDCQELRNTLQLKYTDKYKEKEYQHWFCGQTPKVDTSSGDSGGGVVYKGRIYGVIAFTGNHAYGATEAAGFMDVCKYEKWIRNITGIKKSFGKARLNAIPCLGF